MHRREKKKRFDVEYRSIGERGHQMGFGAKSWANIPWMRFIGIGEEEGNKKPEERKRRVNIETEQRVFRVWLVAEIVFFSFFPPSLLVRLICIWENQFRLSMCARHLVAIPGGGWRKKERKDEKSLKVISTWTWFVTSLRLYSSGRWRWWWRSRGNYERQNGVAGRRVTSKRLCVCNEADKGGLVFPCNYWLHF